MFLHGLIVPALLVTLASVLLPQTQPPEIAGTPVQEFPSVRLPIATGAAGTSTESAAVLSVLADGKVVASTGLLFDPAEPDERPLVEWLVDTAGRMPRKALPANPNTELPDSPLLLRVDAMAEFGHVARIMSRCGQRDVSIWRLEFATVAKPEKDGARFLVTAERGLSLQAHLLVDCDEEPESLEVGLHVVRAGAKLKDLGTHVFDATRRLEYQVGERVHAGLSDIDASLVEARARGITLLVIDATKGVVHGEVVAVMEVARRAGFESFSFVGR